MDNDSKVVQGFRIVAVVGCSAADDGKRGGRWRSLARGDAARRGLCALALAGCASGSPLAGAQEQPAPEYFAEAKTKAVSVRLSGELRAHYRWSEDDRFPLLTAFPPSFVPVGEPNVALRTVAAGSSLEVSKATLRLDVELPRQVSARVKVDFLDLHDRNPTSTDKKVDLDEAWVGFGSRPGSLEPLSGTSFYALVGKAPKFERQPVRRLESYGVVSTAFNRFPDLQLQAGGHIGPTFYFFGQISSGNPIFMRDPNALAGDHGTGSPPPPNPHPELPQGFPIFYHAEVEDLEFDGRFEFGGGAGLRWLSDDRRTGLDLLAFAYGTELSDAAPLYGTFYRGDLKLLQGAGIPPDQLSGRRRSEYGANLDLRLGGFSAFAQVVAEESANLPRHGFEVEASYRLVLGDPADSQALFPVLEPAIRYSRLDNDWTAPPDFITLSALWDWQKWDLGLRATVIGGLDLTLEYAHNEIAAPRDIAHDEFLTTLRLRF